MGAATTFIPKEAAAVSAGGKNAKYGPVFGLKMSTTRATRGAISLSSSSHLPAKEGSKPVNPVTFATGRGKLITKPLAIGLATFTNTIGSARVSCGNAAITEVL